MMPFLIIVWALVLVALFFFVKRTLDKKRYYDQRYKRKVKPGDSKNETRKPDSRVIDDEL